MVDEIFDKGRQGQVLHADDLFRSTESLIAELVQPTVHHHVTNIITNSTEVQIMSVGPNASRSGLSHLTTTDVTLDIDLHGIAKNYNGSASIALVVYNNMEEVLNASLFRSDDYTVKNTMMSKVVSVISPKTLNNTLPNPVNITLRHLTESGPEDEPVCVNWRASVWMVDSCNASRTNSTHTVCPCEHLSTFALIMQTHNTPKRDPVLELVNTVLVVVGLVFLTLAVLTFALCPFNGRVTNAARLNLCVCLLLAHLLLLLSQRFLHLIRPHQVLCKALAALQHFLFLCCFLWMSIEALLLFLSVRRLKRVNSHPRAGPHWAYNLLIGYGIPLVIVGVSASVFPDGYGSQQCWLQVDYGFNWSFLGPMCFILTGNIILFIAILINVHFTLKEARSNISKLKYTRLLLFKIMAQFIILGCPWILGMFLSSSRVLEVLFLLFTSQQGTFIFLVHCLLNDECSMPLMCPHRVVQYARVLMCPHRVVQYAPDVPSPCSAVWRQYARWWTVSVPSRGHLVSTATSSVSLNKIMSMV
ncbi:adhesion G protein-coupled receptor E3-like [Alosa pseudoharengus]|uniref:adhesion G protein-coupled receptor E3-like n=1 Tax=Alosa pseudoharengus TaxID=34774 RepID=UPI003F8CE0C7